MWKSVKRKQSFWRNNTVVLHLSTTCFDRSHNWNATTTIVCVIQTTFRYYPLQVSYAIGVAEPLSIHVDTYATAKEGTNDKQILAAVKKAFDFRPGENYSTENPTILKL